jgi:septum formation protein
LILASASPRRRELLGLLGLDFEVVPSAAEELTDGEPADVVVENALRKARAVAAGAGETLVLGADTDVAIDGRLLGKAGSADEARARLRTLAGRSHEVLGGVAVVRGDDELTEVVRTTVAFRELSEAEVDAYVASGEWEDRAGAYAVQGLGASLVERVDGDLSNVIGLPIPTVCRMIASLQDRK